MFVLVVIVDWLYCYVVVVLMLYSCWYCAGCCFGFDWILEDWCGCI